MTRVAIGSLVAALCLLVGTALLDGALVVFGLALWIGTVL